MYEVALFPIPNSVNFPWVPCPLHVFEPRYRQMVQYCLENEVWMGVCHTRKVLHQNDRQQTVEEALSSNQATYKPVEVFSAGPVTLLQELPDGRLMIRVDNERRLQLGEEKQTLPFSLWSCEALDDEADSAADETALTQARDKILNRLLALAHGNDEVQRVLKSDEWQSMTPQKFSFAVAGFLGMPADTAQSLLEMRSARQRLDAVLGMLNSI